MAGVIASKVRKQRGAVKAQEDDPTTAKILNAAAIERWRQQVLKKKEKEIVQARAAVEDEEDYNPGNCNILLYFGLGLLCVGSVITFVGVGEKGYQTVELRLVGPILSVAGVLLVCFRVILCFVVIL